MAFSIPRSDLVGALAHLARGVEKRSTIPILSFLKFEPGANGAGLRLTATDLDIEMVARLDLSEGHVDQPFAAPAHILHDMARKLPDKAVVAFETAEIADGRLTVRSGRAKFTINILSADDFPQAPGPQEPARFHMAAASLSRLFGRAQFAMSTEETRYYLNGVYFHATDDGGKAEIRAVATDGHRLAQLTDPAPNGAAAMPAVIVPRKAIGEIVRLALDAPDHFSVEVEISAAKSRFAFGALEITTKNIDGTFPDYARVIPQAEGTRALFSRDALAKAADRVATISTERGRAVKLDFADGLCRLTAVSPDVGTASEEIDCPWDAAPMAIGFNAAYLAQILGAMPGEQVALRVIAAESPSLIEDPDDASALIILMPMKVA